MRSTHHAVAPLAVALETVLVVVLVATLAGCGQKGPLVLPDTDTSGVVIRPSPTPAATPSTVAPSPTTASPAATPAPAAATVPPAATPASDAPPTTPPDDPTAPRRDPAPRR